MSLPPEPSPGPTNYQTPDQTFQNPSEPADENDLYVKLHQQEEKRNIIKLKLRDLEENYAQNRDLNLEDHKQTNKLLDLNLLESAKMYKKEDCKDNISISNSKDDYGVVQVQEVGVLGVKVEKGETSDPNIVPDSGSDRDDVTLENKGLEEGEKSGLKCQICKQTFEKLERIDLGPTAAHEFDNLYEVEEQEVAGDDNSTLNDITNARSTAANDLDFGKSELSNLNQLDTELEAVKDSTLNSGIPPISNAANKHVNKSKVSDLNQATSELEAPQGDSSTLNDRTNLKSIGTNELEVCKYEQDEQNLPKLENVGPKEVITCKLLNENSKETEMSGSKLKEDGLHPESSVLCEQDDLNIKKHDNSPLDDVSDCNYYDLEQLELKLEVSKTDNCFSIDQKSSEFFAQAMPLLNKTAPLPAKTTPLSPQTTPISDQTTPSPVETPAPARLRGYLLKRGGALKAWKQRWFVFVEERNSLVYFRTPRDMTPLGQVCLSRATFTCEGAEPGVFYLHTPERTVTLKAQTEELKFFWLQQLQLKRWIHKSDCTTDSNTGAELFSLLQSVEAVNTEETVSQPLLLQLSLKHPLIELQNTVQSLMKRSSNEWGHSVFHVQAPAPHWTLPTASPVNQPAEKTSTNQRPEPPPSANQNAEMAPIDQNTGGTGTNQNTEMTPTIQKARDTEMNAGDTPTSEKKGRTQTNQKAGQDRRSSSAPHTPPQASPTPLPLASAAPKTTPTAGHVTLRRKSRSFLRRNTPSWTERSRLQQELQDQKDLVAVLQKALELCQSERQLRDQPDLNQTTEDQNLRRHLDQTQVQLEELNTSLNQKDQIIQDLQKEVRELSEKNRIKQQVIQKLADCVSRWTQQSSDVDRLSVQNLVQQNQQLQDDLQAFQNQNRFLNSEIHQLSGLWRTSSEGERVLMAKVSTLRGQYLQVLKEVNEGDMAKTDAVRRLIEDALKQEQNQVQVQAHRDKDQYGFQLGPDFEVEDIKLLSKIHALELRTHQNQDALERPLVARWQQYMSSCRGDLSPSPELKTLIRTGIPPHLRPKVWNWIIRTRTQRDQDSLRYQRLCEQIDCSPQSGSRPWSRQIDLDLPRTLCTNQNFSSPSSPALQQLRRILLAFSWENPAVGYCQGLNRVAGLILLVLGSEEDSFWALKAVVENIMPQDYYTPSLVGSQADQLVLKDFLWEKLPRVAAHLDRCGVDVSTATFTWFLVVFVEVLPSDILLPLWDAFLYEGSKVLFRFSLALFKLKESEILQLSTALELHQYFRVLTKTVPDYRRLAAVAFNELNPFPRRALRNRRAIHLERLQRELCDLQRQQSLFLSQWRHNSTEGGAGEEEEVLDNNSEEED